MARNLCRLLRNERFTFKQYLRACHSLHDPVTLSENVRIIDYRSDTLSKPSAEMRKKMYEAEVGDDVFGEDPTVKELEIKAAKLLGKESAVFVPSGTMSNLLAVITHSHNRGCEIIVGHESHIVVSEQAGAAYLAGVQLRTVLNKPDGTFEIKELMETVRDPSNMFQPRTSLVCLENTHNNLGGRVLPLSWLKELSTTLKDLKIPLHMDGARFFNAVVKSGLSPDVMAEGCDTINICLSKGLGAPVGSLLVGPEETILKARVHRKALGGSMRQSGILAAAGIYALDCMIERLKEDHDRAYKIAKAIYDANSNIVFVDLDSVETNIVMIKLDPKEVTAKDFCKRLMMVSYDEMKEDQSVSLRMRPRDNNTVRLIVCCNISLDDECATIRKLQRVIAEYDNV